MKILLITQDFPPVSGGIQTYCQQLAEGFARLEHSVTVVCPQKRFTAGINYKFKTIQIHSSFLFLPLIWFIRPLLKQEKPDHIVYGQWQSGLWHLLFPSLARRYPKCCLVHGRELLQSVWGPFSRPMARKVLATMNHHIPNSHAVAGLLSQLMGTIAPAPAYTIVHPGVDPNLFVPVKKDKARRLTGLPQDKLILLNLTRQVPRKRTIDLILVMPKLLDEFPNLILVIAGTGPELETLRLESNRLGLEKSVVFLGKVPDVKLSAVFNASDIFALPSIQTKRDVEGFGIVFLEAAACAIPVISTRSGGIADAVVDNHTGILVQAQNNDKLYEAIKTYLKDPELRLRHGLNGRKRVENELNWQKTCEKILLCLQTRSPGR